MEAGDEKAGERMAKGGSSVWPVLWPVQAEGPQRAGRCTCLPLRRPGPHADPGVVSLWTLPAALSVGMVTCGPGIG